MSYLSGEMLGCWVISCRVRDGRICDFRSYGAIKIDGFWGYLIRTVAFLLKR
jgi:hypothetical protein